MIRRYLGKEWVLGLILSLLLLVGTTGSVVSTLNGWLFDAVHALTRPSTDARAAATIVHLDAKSLAALGGSQRARQGLVQVLEKLRNVRSDVCILVPLNEAQRNPALESLASLKEEIESAGLPKKSESKLTSLVGREIASLDVDARLVAAMRKLPRVILPLPPGNIEENADDAAQQPREKFSISALFAAGVSPLHPLARSIPAGMGSPLPEFSKQAGSLGTFELLADDSGRVRGFTLLQPLQDETTYSIPLLLAAGKTDNISMDSGVLGYGKRSMKTGRTHQGYFRIYPDTPFVTYTLSQILDGDVKVQSIKGDIIIADDEFMQKRFPVSGDTRFSAAELIALAAGNLKNGDLFSSTDLFSVIEWALYLLASILLVLLLPYMRYVYCVAIAAVAVLTLAGFSGYLLLAQQLWMKTGLPILLLLAGLTVTGLMRLYTSQSARHRTDVAQTLRQLGLAYQEQGKKEQAFEAFSKLPPENENLELIYNLALDFERQRRYERAAAVYMHIMMANPSFKDVARRRSNAEKMGLAAMTGSGQFSHAVLLMPDADGQKPKLGRYEVEKEIGKGAMGAVYLGRDPKIDRTVAIKTLALSQEFEADELKEVEGRFFHEAAAAGKLNHPNIVTIYDAGEEHDLAYIAMEFLEGRPLSDYARESKLLPVDTVLDIIAQVAGGLDYAAKAGVVHRDIKPANIMYNIKSGVVKITDFGIARLTSSSRTKTGTILGTPSYMSPEQITSQKVDGRTDIFSLGATLFVLLTGKRPFDADSLAGLTFQITSEKHRDPLKLRPELPSCIKAVIDKALQKDPANRYQDGTAMRRAILRCMKKIDAE